MAAQAKPLPDKTAEQFGNAKRPEIMRLVGSDPMSPTPATKALGQRFGKDGRSTVSDLILARAAEEVLRESDAALRKELAEERRCYEVFRFEESLHMSRRKS